MIINKKKIILIILGLFSLMILTILISLSGSNKGLKEVKDETPRENYIRPETVVFRVDYKAKLHEEGIWHVKHKGVNSNYIDIKRVKQIPSGGLVAVVECFNQIVNEEQINNELILLATKSSVSSDAINVSELLEKKFQYKKLKKSCEVRNDTGVVVDFVSRSFGGMIREGDLLGHFIDRNKFSQTFVIDGSATSLVDRTALTTGANIVITADAVITEGKIWNVDQLGDRLVVTIEPDESHRKEKIYLDKETFVRISRSIEMSADEYNSVKESTMGEITILRRN